MKSDGWQRARTAEQRAERERQILESAERLFTDLGYERVTMQMIAREIGVSQSNLYRYFSTREEVFLRLFLDDLSLWLEEVIAFLRPDMDMETFAEGWTDILLRQKRLLELHPHLAVSLERNASEGVYRETKLRFRALLERGLSALRAALPFPSDGAALAFLQVHVGLTSGLAPMAKYSPMQEKVLAESGLSSLKIDFRTSYRRAIETYLKGALDR